MFFGKLAFIYSKVPFDPNILVLLSSIFLKKLYRLILHHFQYNDSTVVIASMAANVRIYANIRYSSNLYISLTLSQTAFKTKNRGSSAVAQIQPATAQVRSTPPLIKILLFPNYHHCAKRKTFHSCS